MQNDASQEGPGWASSAKQVNRRQGAPRSRHGCFNCRKRRVKCDEQRPVCQKCVEMEIVCVYDRRRNSDASAQIDGQTGGNVWANLALSRYQIPFSYSGGSNDRKAIHYYFSHVATNLSNYSANNFWETLVAQACVGIGSTVVSRCVIALSEAHLRRTGTEASADATTSSSQAFAVASLNRYMQGRDYSASTVLTCCALLISTEKIRGRYEEVARHLQGALNILRQRDDIPPDLTRHLMILDLEASMQDISRVPCLELQLFDSGKLQIPMRGANVELHRVADPAPLYLVSGDHATLNCHLTHQGVWRFMIVNQKYRRRPIEVVPRAVLDEWRHLAQQLHTYRRGLDDYDWRHQVIALADWIRSADDDRLPPGTTAESLRDAIRILMCEVHYLTAKWFLLESIGNRHQPRPWDRNPQKLLQMSERGLICIKAYKTHFMPDDPRRSFTAHVGFEEGLLGLAHRTSYPAIRTRCMELVLTSRELAGLSKDVPSLSADGSSAFVFEEPGHAFDLDTSPYKPIMTTSYPVMGLVQ